MGLLDWLLGRQQKHPAPSEGDSVPAYAPGGSAGYPPAHQGRTGPQDSTTGATPEDQAAIARYRYLLRTAPPERIEQVHQEAFARLTPQQRQAVLAEMTRTLPPEEAPRSEDPAAMARAATRAEMAQPGYMQRTFARPGMGMGGMFAGSMLGTIAGVVVGSAVADMLLGGFDGSPEAADLAGGGEGGDFASDPGADAGGGMDSGQDYAAVDDGGGWGDAGGFGDFGGGDFGGDIF